VSRRRAVLGSQGGEDIEVGLWIEHRLKSSTYLNDTTSPNLGLNGRVYHSLAPTDALAPMVTYSLQSSNDVYAFGAGGNSMAVDQIWTVKVQTPADDLSNVKMYLDQIRRVLTIDYDRVIRTLPDGSVWQTDFTCRRGGSLEFSESHAGSVVHHLGHMYHVTATSVQTTAPTGSVMAGVSDGSSPTVLP
jgi:hypothetical protein